MSAQELIIDHLDLWSGAVTAKSTAGQGTSSRKRGKIELTGIKKLRELILELAVRGKLVEQDPNDEPASVLLERIAEEKAQLVKAGKIKKPKKLPVITEEEKPFELPDGWAWARLGNITSKIGSGATPRGGKIAYAEAGIPFLRSQNIWNDGLSLEEVAYIFTETHEKMANTHVLPNDILLNITGASLGRCTIVPESLPEANVSQHVTIIRTTKSANRDYLHKAILSPYTQGLVWGRQVGMAREGLSKKVLELFEIPIPPEEQQHRIVEKVDELMALCDRLEQQVGDQLEAHEVLVDTLLDALTRSADAAEVAESWARIAEHFDILFTTEASIDKLKQSLLQLAVMGRLVEQDPTDEPASVLLERIAEEKARLIKEGTIKQSRDLPVVTEDEKPFELPNGWAWARVGDVLSIKHGFAFKSQYFREEESPYVLMTPGNFHEGGGFRDRGKKTKYYDGQVDSDFVLSEGDLIIPMTEQAPGLLGSAAFVPNDGKTYLHNQRLGKLIIHSDLTTKRFIFWFFNCRVLRSELAKTCTGTTVRHTSPEKVRSVLFPVMSPKEQYRIVEKVDELMALCDQLKARLGEAGETRTHLAEAVVEKAVS